MKTKQEAEREEHQRIKGIVLNYDLREEDQDGDDFSVNPIEPNYNIKTLNTGLERLNVATNTKIDKSGNNRSGQRARKLQLSDVDWYGEIPSKPSTSNEQSGGQSESRKTPSDESTTSTSNSKSSGSTSASSHSTASDKDAPVFALREAANSRPVAFAPRGRGGFRGRGRGRGRGWGPFQPMRRLVGSESNIS